MEEIAKVVAVQNGDRERNEHRGKGNEMTGKMWEKERYEKERDVYERINVT